MLKTATKAATRGNAEAGGAAEESASDLISAKIAELGDWRGKTLAQMRGLIRQADPEAIEELKWRGVPVWSDHGIICTGEVYKQIVKLTFAKGASLSDPAGLFNASLEGNTRRAIDIHEGETIDEGAFVKLVQAAVSLNKSKASKSASRPERGGPNISKANGTSGNGGPRLLSGGNPQIPKGDGELPVQAYLAAAPGWKQDIGRQLDALIVRAVPNVNKAIKWNSPFYGIAGQGWFLNFHCFTKYVKVAFFRGASLNPLPPGESKDKNVRYLDIHEGEALDEKLVTDWIRQAAALPGWTP